MEPNDDIFKNKLRKDTNYIHSRLVQYLNNESCICLLPYCRD